MSSGAISSSSSGGDGVDCDNSNVETKRRSVSNDGTIATTTAKAIPNPSSTTTVGENDNTTCDLDSTDMKTNEERQVKRMRLTNSITGTITTTKNNSKPIDEKDLGTVSKATVSSNGDDVLEANVVGTDENNNNENASNELKSDRVSNSSCIDTTNQNTTTTTTIVYDVLDEGIVRSDGRRYYDSIRLTIGQETYTIHTGTPVYLNKSTSSSFTNDTRTSSTDGFLIDDWLCCVDGFFYTTSTSTNSTDHTDGNSSTTNELASSTHDQQIAGDTKNIGSNHNNIHDNNDNPNNNVSATSTNTDGTRSSLRMIGSWFLSPKEVMELSKRFKFRGENNATFAPNEVVLSNIQEEHDVATILRICKFDTKIPTNDRNKYNKRMSERYNQYILPSCRYKVVIDSQNCIVRWATYRDNNSNNNNKSTASITNSADDGTISTRNDDNEEKEKENEEVDDSENDNDTDSESDDIDNDENNIVDVTDTTMQTSTRPIQQEGEGSTLRCDIAVGPKYQISVKPYNPNYYKSVQSRNPKLVWKPVDQTKLTDEQFHQFLSDLATIHTKYLQDNNLVILNEPYSPLKAPRAEQIIKERLEKRRQQLKDSGDSHYFDDDSIIIRDCYLIGSSMSSASMLVGSNLVRNDLLRECDVDKVLQLLHDHNYDTRAALATASQNLFSITTVWNKTEREMFDLAYRQHQSTAALREISQVFTAKDTTTITNERSKKSNSNSSSTNNNITTTSTGNNSKTLKDVVDYHHRFKISDQFRKIQDKKREHALRMLEVIESRRTIHDVVALTTTTTTTTVAAATTTDTSSSSTVIEEGGEVIEKSKIQQPQQQQENADAEQRYDDNILKISTKQQLHWSEQAIAAVAVERDERIRNAKKLLMDVRDTLGSDVMKDVTDVIRKLHVSYDPQLRESLFQLLPNQPELQNRFLEFLPRLF